MMKTTESKYTLYIYTNVTVDRAGLYLACSNLYHSTSERGRKEEPSAMRILFLVHDSLTVPLGISYLSALSREKGHSVMALSFTGGSLESRLGAFKPDIIGFGSTTGFHRQYLDLVKPVRKALGIPVIMGGAHPTFFPEVMEENPWLDFAMRGEAEYAFPMFLRALQGEIPFEEVGNLIFRKDGKIVQNPLIPLVQDLDTIPFPDRNILTGANKHAVFCITSRGCPYNCTYCFNLAYRNLYADLGTYCRRRTVDNVIQELKEVKRLNPELQMIVFQDDIFILNHNWVREFCEKYPGEIGLPFHCHFRANLVTPEIASLLSEAGCISAKMAIETAVPELRNNVLGRDMDDDALLRAFEAIQNTDIKLITQNILGIPTSTLEDDFTTLDLNRQAKPAFAFATLMQPYPRTQISQFCLERGLINGDETIPDSFFDDTILKMDQIGKRKRLRQLFALGVEFTLVRKMIPFLIKLPLDALYSFLDKVWKGYCIKQREFPYKISFGEYLSNVLLYFRSRYY